MKTSLLLTSLFAGITALATLGAAEKQQRADVPDYPFWTTKKRANATQFVPGLNAVIQLTEAQKEQIAAARAEMVNNEAVKTAKGLSKNDPAVTAEQREKARAAVEAATARLRERVAAILTPEQNALIAKVNSAYTSAMEDVGTVYEDKFASVKADPAARQRLQLEKNQDTEDQFLHKLDALLTPGQKEAMTRAAEEEQHRNTSAAGAKKTAKP